MRLDKIILHNFASFADAEVDFSNFNGPVLINATNGAGKSTIGIDSTFYALFGEVRSGNVDDQIKHNTNEMSITLYFSLNGQNIILQRSKKRDKQQKISLNVDGIEIEELNSELQKRIDNLIGLSPEAFRSTIFLKQEDSNFFTKSKPEEKLSIISEILNLAQYERLEKIARDKRSDLKSDIKAKQASVANMEDVDIEQLEQDFIQADKYLKKNAIKITKLEEELEIIRKHNTEVLEQINRKNAIEKNNLAVQNRIDKNKNNIAQSEKTISELTLYLQNYSKKDIEPLQEEIEKIQNLLENLSENLNEYKEELSSIIKEFTKEQNTVVENCFEEYQTNLVKLKNVGAQRSKLENLNDVNCPTCLRELNEKEIEKMKIALDNEIDELSMYHLKYESAWKNAKVLAQEISQGDFDVAKKMQNKIDKFKQKQIEAKQQLKELQEIYQKEIKNQQDIIANKEKIKSSKENIITANEDIEFLKTQFQELPKIKEELQDEKPIKDKITEAKNTNDEGIRIKAQIESNIKNAKKETEIRAKTMDEISKSFSELELVEELVVAFSKNGIPSSIVKTILPEIQDNSNFFLNKMSEEGLELRFETTTTLKNGNEKNTFEIFIYDGQVWRNFDTFSGGECFRVSLAIRLALSQVLARRAGIQLETLVIDEGATSLDEAGVQAYCSVIKSLQDVFPRIILTSHLNTVASEIDNRITLKKTLEGTIVV